MLLLKLIPIPDGKQVKSSSRKIRKLPDTGENFSQILLNLLANRLPPKKQSSLVTSSNSPTQTVIKLPQQHSIHHLGLHVHLSSSQGRSSSKSEAKKPIDFQVNEKSNEKSIAKVNLEEKSKTNTTETTGFTKFTNSHQLTNIQLSIQRKDKRKDKLHSLTRKTPVETTKKLPVFLRKKGKGRESELSTSTERNFSQGKENLAKLPKRTHKAETEDIKFQQLIKPKHRITSTRNSITAQKGDKPRHSTAKLQNVREKHPTTQTTNLTNPPKQPNSFPTITSLQTFSALQTPSNPKPLTKLTETAFSLETQTIQIIRSNSIKVPTQTNQNLLMKRATTRRLTVKFPKPTNKHSQNVIISKPKSKSSNFKEKYTPNGDQLENVKNLTSPYFRTPSNEELKEFALSYNKETNKLFSYHKPEQNSLSSSSITSHVTIKTVPQEQNFSDSTSYNQSRENYYQKSQGTDTLPTDKTFSFEFNAKEFSVKALMNSKFLNLNLNFSSEIFVDPRFLREIESVVSSAFPLGKITFKVKGKTVYSTRLKKEEKAFSLRV